MEQSDQTQKGLILATPSQLVTQQVEVSHDIASLVAFMEFLKELKETVEHEHMKAGLKSNSHTLQKYPENYRLTMHFDEGSYSSSTFRDYKYEWNFSIYDEVNAPELSLRLLTKLIYGTIKNTSPFLKGRKVLSSQDSDKLMQSLSFYLGFYNFLPTNGDRQSLRSDLNIFCRNMFTRLCEPISLSASEWQKLREAANHRVRERLRHRYYQGTGQLTWSQYDPSDVIDKRRKLMESLIYNDSSAYRYNQLYEKEEIEQIVPLIVQGEEERLRNIVEVLHGTLKVLANLAVANKQEALSQETEILDTLQSLLALLKAEKRGTTHSENTHTIEGTIATSPTQKVNIKKVEHKGQSYIYHIELTDPGVLPEPCTFTVTYNQDSEADEVLLQEDDSDG